MKRTYGFAAKEEAFHEKLQEARKPKISAWTQLEAQGELCRQDAKLAENL